jgi:hypothetical protein
MSHCVITRINISKDIISNIFHDEDTIITLIWKVIIPWLDKMVKS